MKHFISLIFLGVLLSANEMDRIEMIIKDVENLRKDYAECINELDTQTLKYLAQKENKISDNSNDDEKKILKQSYEKRLQEKNKIISSLETQIKKLTNTTIRTLSTPQNIETFKASNFRLSEDSKIYNAIDGKVIDTWEIETSFTSGTMTQDWIKITGYFIDRKWLKAKKDMWIKKNHIKKR